jgi:hypothetical protein
MKDNTLCLKEYFNKEVRRATENYGSWWQGQSLVQLIS